MRMLLLLLAVAGCSTGTLRTGVVIVGSRPAFQASIEFGISVMGKRRGVTGTHEWGVEAGGDHGTRAIGAMNVDVFQNDPEEGPVARAGVRLRGAIDDDPTKSTSAVLARGAAFVGLGRDVETRSGGLGIAIAGGIAFAPIIEPIYEVSLVLAGRWMKGSFME